MLLASFFTLCLASSDENDDTRILRKNYKGKFVNLCNISSSGVLRGKVSSVKDTLFRHSVSRDSVGHFLDGNSFERAEGISAVMLEVISDSFFICSCCGVKQPEDVQDSILIMGDTVINIFMPLDSNSRNRPPKYIGGQKVFAFIEKSNIPSSVDIQSIKNTQVDILYTAYRSDEKSGDILFIIIGGLYSSPLREGDLDIYLRPNINQWNRR